MTKHHHLPPLAPPESKPQIFVTLCWMVPLWLTVVCGLFIYFGG